MDKNTIIGFILMAAILIGFTILNKPSEEEIARQKEQARRDSIAYAQNLEESARLAQPKGTDVEKNNVDDFFAVPQQVVDTNSVFDSLAIQTANTEEQTYVLENNKLKLEVSSKGGQIVSVQIKGYKAYNKIAQQPTDSLYLFDRDAQLALILTNIQGKQLRTSNLNFYPVGTTTSRELTMRYAYGDNQYVDFIYMLDEDDYFVKYHIQMVGMKDVLHRETEGIFQLAWSQRMRQLEKSTKNEQQYSRIRFKRMTGDVDGLAETKDDKTEITETTKWLAFKNQFFASILIADDKFENLLLESKITETDKYLKAYDAMAFLPATVDINNNLMNAGTKFYFGPLGSSHLQAYDDGKADSEKLNLDELVPLGWGPLSVINKYFVIPIFDFLSSTGLGTGLVILLLTIIVKIVIAPLTYKGYMSSAKMRVLRPQVEELSAKYPKKEQAMEKQQAVMALYNKAGANPMSGCIPMLLQMPVLIALFRFFPSAIELRQESFLWADDLSTYDAIITFPFSIPLLGDHLSLFCILMTITNVIYAKFNMQMTSTGSDQMPGMKWMMYLMPVAFLFILNDFPSGLTYYYFISLLITILLTLMFRFIVDEEKVLAKLEANKAKPKKKSGFMARLEEAQRMQQQQMKQQNKRKK